MKANLTSPVTVAVVFLLAASAFAQYPVANPAAYVGAYPGACPSSGPVVPVHQGPYAVYRHASTFEEGLLRGYADLTRARGEYALYASAAAIQFQDAYSRCLDNQKKGVQTYFETRAINREGRALERGPRPTAEQLREYAKQGTPKRLGTHELDATFGIVHWPAALQGPELAAERKQVDQFMSDRSLRVAQNGGNALAAIKPVIRQMESTLRTQVGSLSPMEYVKAKKFLGSLAYEATQPPALANLAAR